MNHHQLTAWTGSRQVGILSYDDESGLFAFDYDDEWSSSGIGYPISPALPFERLADLNNERHSISVRRFFENLLPEGKALDDAAAVHRVSKANLYGLLAALGGETTGALSLLPEGSTPTQLAGSKRELTDKELHTRIHNRPYQSFHIWDGKVRMSIAGYQDKLAVFIEEGHLYLVEGRLASTHILKPEPLSPDLPHLVANEHFCLRLASELGLPASPVDILRVPDPVLTVERFDRHLSDGHVGRIHVVDACQCLNLSVSHKYERNFGSGRDVAQIRDGVSIERLFSISSDAISSAAMRLGLLRWVLLQYLIGNSDAHGKNLSFFVEAGGLKLAPTYDLVSICVYPKVDHELAMAIGDEFNLSRIMPYDWAELAASCDLDRRLVAREMLRMTKALRKALPSLQEWEGYSESERGLVHEIAEFTLAQAKLLEEHARQLPEVEIV